MQFFQLDTLGNVNDSELGLSDGAPEGMELHSYCMAFGDSTHLLYPAEAKISLREDRPGIKLSSLLGNTNSYLIVHSTMKDVIEAHCQGIEVEFLPFDLHDHRKRLYSRDYFIINPLGTHDCLDPVASGVQRGPEGSVIHVESYTLDPRKATHLPRLLRPNEDPSVYIVSEELASALRDKGFTNVQLNPLPFSPGS
ncbi:imm11 family protein [Myxococcus sp. CA040A]|uniref:imm11 family protein n=1 Tax=Myxococcus sp. CA040A TaxID=2741738 RepID=UPI00157A9BC7|nr:DUF1629 domain-containing protein [Myxococcus sp. CA040A]NTX02422.1 hypothetical protein [Myxococcus sp. CA040A]